MGVVWTCFMKSKECDSNDKHLIPTLSVGDSYKLFAFVTTFHRYFTLLLLLNLLEIFYTSSSQPFIDILLFFFFFSSSQPFIDILHFFFFFFSPFHRYLTLLLLFILIFHRYFTLLLTLPISTFHRSLRFLQNI